jgi:hypothetical protein
MAGRTPARHPPPFTLAKRQHRVLTASMKTQARLHARSLLTLVLVAFVLAPSGAAAATFTAKGTVIYLVHNPVTHLDEPPLISEFEAVSDGCSWKVRMVLVESSDFEHFTYTYDGTNQLRYFELRSGPMASAVIENCPVPAMETSAAPEYVWLALCSGDYFKTHTNYATVFDLARSKDGFIRRFDQPCRVTLNPAAPHLPSSVEYIQTNGATGLKPGGVLASLPFPPSFKAEAYVRGRLVSSGATNVGGLTLPTSFEYKRYYLKPDAITTNDVACVVTVTGKVTSVSVNDQPVDTSLPKKDFALQDLRVPQANVLYPISDGIIPPSGSEAQKAGIDRAAAMEAVNAGRH